MAARTARTKAAGVKAGKTRAVWAKAAGAEAAGANAVGSKAAGASAEIDPLPKSKETVKDLFSGADEHATNITQKNWAIR